MNLLDPGLTHVLQFHRKSINAIDNRRFVNLEDEWHSPRDRKRQILRVFLEPRPVKRGSFLAPTKSQYELKSTVKHWPARSGGNCHAFSRSIDSANVFTQTVAHHDANNRLRNVFVKCCRDPHDNRPTMC